MYILKITVLLFSLFLAQINGIFMGTGNKFTISRVRYNTVLRNGGIISPPERNRIHPRFRCEGRVDLTAIFYRSINYRKFWIIGNLQRIIDIN